MRVNPSLGRPRFVGWTLLAACTVLFPRLSQAETAHDADVELNRTYQLVLRTLSPGSREKLRRAQRAWLTFTNLNDAALAFAGQRLGLGPDEIEANKAGHLRLRTNELKQMLAGQDSLAAGTTGLSNEDSQLNRIYRQCTDSLGSVELEKLRAAQRAWMSFRDASLPFGSAVCAGITKDRTEQLRQFYLEHANANPTPDPNVPDPFESAR